MQPLRFLGLVTAITLLAAACTGGYTPTPSPTVSATPTAVAIGTDGPGRGVPTLISVGDSYISGEGGRWAGSVQFIGGLDSTAIDALGPTAYDDKADKSGEAIVNCHRSAAAEVHIGVAQDGSPVTSINLACSGATTLTHTDGTDFKPGLDAYGDADGNLATDEPQASGTGISQLVALRQAALTHNVKLVAVSIGGNNFHFADTIEQCVKDFLLSSSLAKNFCYDDAVAANFDAASATARQSEIALALQNVHDAMAGAGYSDDAWTMVVQTPPSPLPRGSAIRYAEIGFGGQAIGGCGFWNDDADWANDTALPVVTATIKAAVAGLPFDKAQVLDLSAAYDGRRLCEDTVGTLNEKGLGSWRDSGAADQTEWIAPVRAVFNNDHFGDSAPYQMQESFHPDYWGELALRDCLRLVYSDGSVQGGSCTIAANGLNDRGEPIMQLAPG